MYPLLLTMFSHSLAIPLFDSSYFFLNRTTGQEDGCFMSYCKSNVQYFIDYNFTAIYITGMVFVFFFALCIIFEMKKIQNEKIDENIKIFKENEALITSKSYSIYV